MPMFEVEFLKNGSKFFNNTSSPARGEYFLSYKPSQPIGRASLWDAGLRRNSKMRKHPNNEMWPVGFMT